jgi:hypothetical protein
MYSTEVEIANIAARIVVEEGLEYGPAKRRAIRQLGISGRVALPSNDVLEEAVREYIETFCADTQPAALRALRSLACVWMERMAAFNPHLGGAVWRGTATELSDIYLQLFCDDPKSAELLLIDKQVRYDVSTVQGFHGDAVDALSVLCPCPGLDQHGAVQQVLVHLMIYDRDDLRGALKPDSHGRPQRGNLQAVKQLMENDACS